MRCIHITEEAEWPVSSGLGTHTALPLLPHADRGPSVGDGLAPGHTARVWLCTQTGNSRVPSLPTAHTCICVCVLIPSKGPHLAPTSQVMRNHFQFWKSLLISLSYLLLAVPSAWNALPPSHCPLTLLLPGKLLLILQGPANCLFLQEASPDPQPGRVSPILLLNHTRCFLIPVTESTWKVEYGISLDFNVSRFLMNTHEDGFVNHPVCLCELLKALLCAAIVLLMRAEHRHPTALPHMASGWALRNAGVPGTHRLRFEWYPLEMDDMPA